MTALPVIISFAALLVSISSLVVAILSYRSNLAAHWRVAIGSEVWSVDQEGNVEFVIPVRNEGRTAVHVIGAYLRMPGDLLGTAAEGFDTDEIRFGPAADGFRLEGGVDANLRVTYKADESRLDEIVDSIFLVALGDGTEVKRKVGATPRAGYA